MKLRFIISKLIDKLVECAKHLVAHCNNDSRHRAHDEFHIVEAFF